MITKIKTANRRQVKNNYNARNKSFYLINNLFQNIQNVSFIKDNNFRYIEVNYSFEQLLELHKSKIIGMTDYELFDKKTATAIRASDKKVISTKAKCITEEVYLVKGQAVQLHISKFPLFDDNKSVIGIGNIGNDISSQKQQGEETERKRNKILSIIAHDLKNPFNSILGIADLLKSHLSEFSLAEINELICSLDNSSKKAVDLFENLLTWTISSWRDDILHRELVNLRSLVNETIMPLKLTAKDKNIIIYNHIKENVNIYIDKNTISAVIRNLINNSLKFTNLGGEINIDARIKDDKIEIIISDNGVGMSDEKIESLFRHKFNGSSNGTFNEKGVGLGLIVCKDFVEKNGGEIWAEKKTSAGSEFHFTIPLNNSSC